MPESSPPTPQLPVQREQPEPALGITLAQVLGSALAAVTGAVSVSWLGVTGTLIGAGLGSVMATIGSAAYTHSLRRSSQVVLRAGTPLRSGPAVRTPVAARALPWPRLALATAAVLAVALGTLSMVEGLTGQPVSSLATGDARGGTTIGSVLEAHPATGHPSPAPDPATGDTPATSPNASPTGEPTAPGPTPDPTPSPDPAPSPDQPPSGAPSPAQ